MLEKREEVFNSLVLLTTLLNSCLQDLFNDVAVLKLSASSAATPVKLNSDISYPSNSGTPLNVIGFGTTSEGGSLSNVLKKLGTFFVPINTCDNNYPAVEFGTHLCANVDNQGDCQGRQHQASTYRSSQLACFVRMDYYL